MRKWIIVRLAHLLLKQPGKLLGGMEGIISIIPLLFLPGFFLSIKMYENSTWRPQFSLNLNFLAAPKDIAEQKI